MKDRLFRDVIKRLAEPIGITLVGVVLLGLVLGAMTRISGFFIFSLLSLLVLSAFVFLNRSGRLKPVESMAADIPDEPEPIPESSTKPPEPMIQKDETLASETGAYQDSAIQMLDDTQASVIFNQTSDAIIDIIHQTFQAHSTVFYLYNEFENEIVLQSFRSAGKAFNAVSRHTLGKSPGTALFQRVATGDKAVFITDGSGAINDLAYYSEPADIHSLILLPLFHKKNRIGMLSVDHVNANAFSERHIGLLEQYGELIVNSIQTIDAVYLKNKLRRMFQSLREYTENVILQNDEEKVLHSIRLMVHSNLQCDRYSLWLNIGNGEEALIFESTEASGFEAGSTRPLKQSIVAEAMTRLKRMYVGDYAHAGDGDSFLPSVLAVPLADQGYCFGVLLIESNEPNAFNSYEIQFVESLCHSAALAMSRFRLDHHLAREMVYDPLTGIENVQAFRHKLQGEILRAKRFGTNFTLVVCEMSSLKHIYEKQGVQAGDFVLEKVAEIVKNSLRQIDSVARIGTDRFGLILLEAKKTEAYECAQRILRNCDGAELPAEGEYRGSDLSFGISIFGEDGDQPDAMAEAAEKALEIARKSPVPKIAFYS